MAKGARDRRARRGRRRAAKGFRIASSRPVELSLYLGFRLLVALANRIPRSAVPVTGRMLGRGIRRFGRGSARVARRNLERSTGIVEADGIDAFLDRFYASLGTGIVELLRLPRAISREQTADLAVLEGEEIIARCREAGRGVICPIGHLGHYEAAAVIVAAAGYPIHSLSQPIGNRYVERYVARLRTRTGNRLIPKDQAAREMLRVLRHNEILVIEIDTDAGPGGQWVEQCGRPASMPTSPARLAILHGSPIVLIECFREDGVDHVRALDPIDPKPYQGRPDGVEALTRVIGADFDRCVRAHPEQWLWLLNRWRSVERARGSKRRVSARRTASGPSPD